MKKYAALYYFLFLLLIMGTFASMAQNTYGLIICGIACGGFIVVFLIELIFPSGTSSDQSAGWLKYTELVTVTAIAFIFMIRNFSIDTSFSGNVLNLLLLVMLWLTVYYAIAQSRLPLFQESAIAWPIACYYAAIVVLVLSFLASSALPVVGNVLSLVGIALVIIFVTLALTRKNNTIVDGPASAWQYVEELTNKSAVLIIAAVLLAGFNLMTSIGVLPPLYSDKVPPGYQILLKQGVVSGSPEKADEFKIRYDQFIDRWAK